MKPLSDIFKPFRIILSWCLMLTRFKHFWEVTLYIGQNSVLSRCRVYLVSLGLFRDDYNQCWIHSRAGGKQICKGSLWCQISQPRTLNEFGKTNLSVDSILLEGNNLIKYMSSKTVQSPPETTVGSQNSVTEVWGCDLMSPEYLSRRIKDEIGVWANSDDQVALLDCPEDAVSSSVDIYRINIETPGSTPSPSLRSLRQS